MQAGYDTWFYSGIAGINPSAAEPGFKKIVFKPYLTKQLKNASASYESPFGTITSAWKNDEGQFTWEIGVPENSRGEVFVSNYKKNAEVSINGKIIQFENTLSDFTSIGELGSGKYHITMKQD
jgi:alpha-L-rhamnosidase